MTGAAYEAELLVLAPEAGEDENALSLTAQLIELGVPIELDENWRLPTSPPKPLSSYRACLFPDTSRARYDDELNEYLESGGHLCYTKYYPTAGTTAGMGPTELLRHGRDQWMFHVANTVLDGGLSVASPDFWRAMASRPLASMVAGMRSAYFAEFSGGGFDDWKKWGDPQCTEVYANLALAEATGDSEWVNLVRSCLTGIARAVQPDGAVGRPSALPGLVSINLVLFSAMLMELGTRFDDDELVQAGVRLGRHWCQSASIVDGVMLTRYKRSIWGEQCGVLPCLYWLARITGDAQYAQYGDALVESVSRRNLRPDGIWRHYTRDDGLGGAAWSRGNGWYMLGMTHALRALPADSTSAQRMVDLLSTNYDGLSRYQDETTGLWRQVLDEPETRRESTGTVDFVYCHDQLRAAGLLDDRHDEMIDRAFTGLKSSFYKSGLSGCCRGTSNGTPFYYRTRPLGYFEKSLFGACVAHRLGS